MNNMVVKTVKTFKKYYFLIILVLLLTIVFGLLIKQFALLFFIFPIFFFIVPARPYNGLFACFIAILVSVIVANVIHPDSISFENWLTSDILFLCVGVGMTYAQTLEDIATRQNKQLKSLQTTYDTIREQVKQFKINLPDYLLIFNEQGVYRDIFSKHITEEERNYLIGKTPRDVPEIVHPKHVDNIMRIIQETAQTGKSQVYHYQTKKHAKYPLWLEAHTASFYNPVLKETQVIWQSRDITRRKTLEDSLKRVQQIAQIGIWETDLETGKIIFSDQMYHVFGITPEEFDHTLEFVHHRMHPDDLAIFQDKVNRGINPYPFEFRFNHSDGSVRYIYAVGDIEHDENNKIIRRVGLAQNITDRRLAEQEHIQLQISQQRSKALSNLLTNLTHDVMTPLTVIKTTIYILNRITDDTHILNHLEKLDRNIDILQKVFENLLAVSHLDDLQFHNLSIEIFDIVPLLRNLTGQYRSIVSNKNQTLTTTLPDHPIRVHYDRNYMQQAISNILQNAMQYTPEGGHITVDVNEEDNYLTINIKDNGIGISGEHINHIFEPFYRVEKHRPSNGNSGMGLQITKLIIELHGGQVSVKSQPGEGCTFSLQLPKINKPTAIQS